MSGHSVVSRAWQPVEKLFWLADTKPIDDSWQIYWDKSESVNSTFKRTPVKTQSHYVKCVLHWFQSEWNCQKWPLTLKNYVKKSWFLCILYLFCASYIPITRTLFWETINESPDVRAHFPLREKKWRAAHLVSRVHSVWLTAFKFTGMSWNYLKEVR